MPERLVTLLEHHQKLGRDHFFSLVRQACPIGSDGYNLIELAYTIANEAHREQFRDSGERYFEHPRAVAIIQMCYMRIRDPKIIAAGLTHDVPEDCKRWPIARIHEHLGEEVACVIDWGNKRRFDHIEDKEERKRRYHTSLLLDAPREVALWKAPDRVHSLITMWNWTPEEIQRKIAETEQYYLPFAEKHGILVHEMEGAIRHLKANRHLLPPPEINGEPHPPGE